MRVCPTVFHCFALYCCYGAAQQTWPSSIDELEDVMFLSMGYRSRGFTSFVTPCSFSAAGPGRQTAAEWLRAGFHDMATTNIYNGPHGGIDASLAFELNSGENIGEGFTTTLTTYSTFYNYRLSLSDLIALGVYAAVRSCGGPIVPIRGGRIDATAAGPIGVPLPQNPVGTFENQFLRMGFDTQDMITMTACGHTLGGVHSGDFPDIVKPGTAVDDFQLFDNTPAFDNRIATQYIAGSSSDPLVVGPSIAAGRNSDARVFAADGNVTMQALTNAATFRSKCASILQRMIETVPQTSVLTDVVQPYEVKPTGLQLTLLSGGNQIKFSGDIRVRTTTRSSSQITKVQLIYRDRDGGSPCGSCTIDATTIGTANGFDDTFTFYTFSINLPVASSISSFTVLITLTSGGTELHDNNGVGFPTQDSIMIQSPQSCLSNGSLIVVAAIRSTISTPVTMEISEKVPRPSGIPAPSLQATTLIMVKGLSIGQYNIYSVNYSLISSLGSKFGVSSGSYEDDFKDPADLGSSCASLGLSASSSSSSSSMKTSTSPSSAATVVPTLRPKQKIGSYSFMGCYTEGSKVRALTGAVFYNYTSMTLELCAASCVGFSYWGVEYGGECYCGNSLAATSTLASVQSSCNFLCPGNSYEYCGAGNRLQMYLLTSLVSSKSNSISSTSSQATSSSMTSGEIFTTPPISTKSSKISFSTSTSFSGMSSSLLSSATASSPPATSSSSSHALTPTLRTVKFVGAYNYAGCYTEGNGVRALSAASFPSDTQTIESCVSACSPYLYAGAEYGRECWCGNSFGAGSVLTADSDCSMTCSGDQYQHCGAGNRLNVYIRNGSTTGIASGGSSRSISSSSDSSSSTKRPVSTQSQSSSSTSSSSSVPTPGSSKTSITTISSTTPTQTSPKIRPIIGPYSYYGCQTEGSNIRALTGAASYNYTAMTLEMCETICSGYKYWAVEYGGECYCGNSFNPGSVGAPGRDADCSFLCPGNALEFCGAGNRLSAYVLTP